MSNLMTRPLEPAKWQKPVAVLALIFGLMTLFSAAPILLDISEAKAAAGAYVPFVLWFNFVAGFFYIIAALGIWQRAGWAFGLSMLIALTTGLAALGFGIVVFQGVEYEMRTVGALALRFGVWLTIATALFSASRRS